LAQVLDYLQKEELGQEALQEKQEAVRLWERIAYLARQIEWRDHETARFVNLSAQYGLKLFRVVAAGWRVLLVGRSHEEKTLTNDNELELAISDYDAVWSDYESLAALPGCPSLYSGKYFSLPGQPEVSGLTASVAHYRRLLTEPMLK
jgi:hypothetical protein